MCLHCLLCRDLYSFCSCWKGYCRVRKLMDQHLASDRRSAVCSHRPMINWVAVVWGFRCDTQVSVRSFPLSSVVFLFCSVYCLLSILSSRCQLIGLDAHYGGPHLYFVLERHALFMCLFFCTPRSLICFTSQDNDFQLGIKFTYIIIFHLIFTVVIQYVKLTGSCAKAHI
jgi:hypothetical protein